MVSVAGPTCPSCVRVRRSAPNERGGRSLGPEHLISRRSLPGVLHPWARAGSRRFLAIHPTPLPCSKTPAEPTRPRLWRSCRHRPPPRRRAATAPRSTGPSTTTTTRLARIQPESPGTLDYSVPAGTRLRTPSRRWRLSRSFLLIALHPVSLAFTDERCAADCLKRQMVAISAACENITEQRKCRLI